MLCSLSTLHLAISINLLWVRCLLLALVNLKIGLRAEDCGSFVQLQESLSSGSLQPDWRERKQSGFCSLMPACMPDALGQKCFFPSVCEAASHPITEWPERSWGMMPASWVVWLSLHTVGRWCFSKLVWVVLILNVSYSPCQYKTTSQYNPLQSYAGQSA